MTDDPFANLTPEEEDRLELVLSILLKADLQVIQKHLESRKPLTANTRKSMMEGKAPRNEGQTPHHPGSRRLPSPEPLHGLPPG
jgi:hypothetical protein